MISIPDFYKNRDIFITGATGFVGKVLIEKLLRSCNVVGRIFVLLRSKRSKSISERLEEIKGIAVSEISLSLLIKKHFFVLRRAINQSSIDRMHQYCRMNVWELFCDWFNDFHTFHFLCWVHTDENWWNLYSQIIIFKEEWSANLWAV